LGFQRAVIPEAQLGDAQGSGLDLIAVPTLADAVRKLLSRGRYRGNRQAEEHHSPVASQPEGMALVMEEMNVGQEGQAIS